MLELHPDPARLRSFGLGRLGAVDAANIEDHIMQCEECCEKLRHVSADGDPLLDLAQEAARTTPFIDVDDSNIPAELIDHPRYRVEEQLGEGGMGTVFKAHHLFMDRTVALKVIQRKFVNNPDAVERFRNEVRMAAKLHHPNIVAAHDAEEVYGLHFLVMEYVDGISLDRFAAKQKSPIPYPLACHIIRQAAVGLQHAHKHGLVHRDIKPQNIMMTRRGQIKILDFGLTRLTADRGFDPGMTRDNLVVGTPDFIAPEQARNSRDVDIRTDIYALGCTFYFLLTRRVPFPGMTPFEKMIAHTEIEPHPVSDFRKDFPPELDAILRKMMAKRREDRYATPNEVIAALAPYAKLNVSSTTASMIVQPVHSESEAEIATEKIDTSEMNDSHTHRITSPVRSRPTPRPARRKRRPKKLPYRKWIAAAMVGTFLMFVLIFMAALRGTSEKEESKPAKDPPPPMLKADEKPPVAVVAAVPEKELAPPKEEEPPKKLVVEATPIARDPVPLFPKGKGFGPDGFQPKVKEGEGFAPLRGKSVLLLVPNRGANFNDIDPVRDALERRGAVVSVVSTDGRVCTDFNGNRKTSGRQYTPTIDLGNNLDPSRHARHSGVICGGGDIGEFLKPRYKNNLEKLLGVMQQENRVFGSIGAGQALLAKTGHLDNREAAKVSIPFVQRMYELTDQKHPTVKWTDKKVIRSGPVVTASGQEAAHDFADEFVKALLESK